MENPLCITKWWERIAYIAIIRSNSIRIVTGDGARWIDSCVDRWRLNAERVLDGFHIVSWMTGALDKVRRRLWNQTRHDEEVAKRMRGAKYAVLKSPGDLTGRQAEAFGNLRDTDPRGWLYRAWQLKELLRTLLKHPIDQATTELNRWVFRASHSRMPEIIELSRKIRRRRPDILRTIQLGCSNARLEASDNRIKVTIRMACGFRHVTNLISLVMLRCGGLDDNARILAHFRIPALTQEGMARVLCTIFIRQNKKPRLEARRRNQDPRTSYRSTRTCSRPGSTG